MDRAGAVKIYFRLGLSYKEILLCLATNHGIVISLRTLKRILLQERLFRRKRKSDLLEVALFLLEECQQSGQMHGYKTMHLKCIQNNYCVSQEDIRLLLHIVDPRGIAIRRRHRLRRRKYRNPGPNYVWHIDSYDKLKPFGICINGAIDGFSRFMLWLEAHTTNSDPKLIGSYFCKTVGQGMLCPQKIRADRGTENVYVEQMQIFFMHESGDPSPENAFIYGSSNHNQRIEQWWGYYRKENAQYWMNLFQTLKDTGSFTGGFLDVSLIQFCFMNLIQVGDKIFIKYLCSGVSFTQ